MKESKLLLSEFANEEGFELNQYLTHLFAYVTNQNPSPSSESQTSTLSISNITFPKPG